MGTSKNDVTDVTLGRSPSSRGSRVKLASGFSVFSCSPAGLFPSQCGLQADSFPDELIATQVPAAVQVKLSAPLLANIEA